MKKNKFIRTKKLQTNILNNKISTNITKIN